MALLSRRRLLAGSALAALYGAARPAFAAGGGTVPWRNWSGALVAHPAGRFSPATEDELAAFLATSSGPVRPVGSGHSFTPLVPTDGHLIVIDRLSGMLGHDPAALRATFAAGTRLGDMGAPLERVGQGMFVLPDIDRQTLAGATATATHGTGISFSSLSGYVTALRLVTPRGEIVDVDADSNRDLFDAARVSLGALGVITRMTLQNRPSYRLKAKNWVAPIEEVLEDFDESAANHRHFEMFPLTHSDYALTLAIDETDEPINNPPPSPEEDAAFAAAMESWTQVPPRDRPPLVNGLAEQIEPTEAVDVSYRILSNVRNTRFNEMEYSVPLEAGAPCLREILRTIRDEEVDVVFPLEYRYVSRDDTWLGMSSGDEDHASISIHRTASEDYRPYFDLIEPIFWKYGGRPHWGKVHSLTAAELDKLYPKFRDFVALRQQLDPDGRMLNGHLRKLFIG
ncbi:MAG: D-arabinono-1,4-lactone oxidase [Pseudomonadales bacterium]